MRTRTVLVVLVTAALTLVGASAAQARTTTETASSGSVSATLSYTAVNSFTVRALTLQITRAGTVAYQAALKVPECASPYCLPDRVMGGSSVHSVTVADLDGDGEPEVLVDVTTGGMQCCSITQVFSWSATTGTYTSATENFLDAGYTLVDVTGDGVPEFRTYDGQFDSLYTSHAASELPVEYLDFRGGAFVDISRTVPTLLAKDATQKLRDLRAACRRGETTLGVLAAWAADEYRLGGRVAALKALRADQRRGCLIGDGQGFTRPTAFITKIDRFLQAQSAYRA